MSVFDAPAFDAHEGVHFFTDKAAGLSAIIAIHSTALGPAAGGCRMWPYEASEGALQDVLRLSRGMSYKNAIAELPLGGGKAVIWGNPRTDKSDALFEAFGRAIDTLGGRYWTAEDVGVSTADMAIVARQTRFVAGLDQGDAASGDPSPFTARGVFEGIKSCAARVFGSDDLTGRHVAVQGVGHVGAYLCRHLAEAGARLTLTDIDSAALAALARELAAETVDPNAIYDVQADVFAPCALGGVINSDTLNRLKVKIIAGAANNQLIVPEMGEFLRRAGVLYAPDYVINGGGIINVAAEISGQYDRVWVETKLARLTETLGAILDQALASDRPTHEIADAMARARIEAAGSGAAR
jgi:leucine dehydrogenase